MATVTISNALQAQTYLKEDLKKNGLTDSEANSVHYVTRSGQGVAPKTWTFRRGTTLYEVRDDGWITRTDRSS